MAEMELGNKKYVALDVSQAKLTIYSSYLTQESFVLTKTHKNESKIALSSKKVHYRLFIY